jgi:dipeptidyl aminopeptidase/acylaminoacyl peptidase
MRLPIACAEKALLLLLCCVPVACFSQDGAPPLVPRQVFDSAPEQDLLTISPDGKTLAYIAPSEKGVANIWVEDLATHARRMVSLSTQRGIGRYEWTYDSTYLIYFSDENGNEDDHLYSIDLKTKVIRDLTPFLGVRADQVLQAAGNTREILVGLNLRDRRLFDIYRVNLETGGIVLDTQNPGDVIGWTADSNLTIRAAIAFNDNLETVVRVRATQQASWRDLLTGRRCAKSPAIPPPTSGRSLRRALFSCAIRGTSTFWLRP